MKIRKLKKQCSISRGAQDKKSAQVPILYEDKNLAVFDKPSGIVVSRDENNVKVDFDPTKFIVHRLDKDTSGVLITAKNLIAQKYLSKQFMERETDKHYIALVCGHLTPLQGRIEAGIGRSATDRKKMSIFSPKLRSAVTHYEVKKYLGPYTLIDARIETGRTHQIRVHLQSIGFPIVGDPVYGNKRVNSEF
ncbi:RluA family pseudouridine synthase, partial [Candidatus Peregrinibacteria bacterium]|nr:RluA family pseudouridine synthase [Candidatus Peregrinibacteria bacterium]